MKEFESVLPELLSVAIEAGKEILSFYDDTIEVSSKEDDSPITKADLAANRVICSALAELAVPGYGVIPVLSEENSIVPYEERKHWDALWLVDPLDGTKEFINRNGDFTVNIALVVEGEPVAGIVFAPAHRLLYFGVLKTGSFRITVPHEGLDGNLSPFRQATSLPDTPREARPYTIIGSRSHSSVEFEQFTADIFRKHPDAVLLSAGSSLKFCRVAEGQADIYPRLGRTMEWDTAAGHAVLRAAGKTVVDFQTGLELRYNKPDPANPWFIVQ